VLYFSIPIGHAGWPGQVIFGGMFIHPLAILLLEILKRTGNIILTTPLVNLL
jgi:hypothetical protein